jgi:uncharacterized protein YecE (DUF72 family)
MSSTIVNGGGMVKGTTNYRVGIGGWEHDELDRHFYPRAEMEPCEKLAFYSRCFDIVEVRATFWDGSLSVDDARSWADAVSANRRFRFSIKLHASFTHKREMKPQLTRTTRALLQELARRDRLSGLLMQFPYSFTNTSASRFHLVKLAELFRGFPLFVEFRHDSWNHPSVLHLLEENNVRLVSADLPRVRNFMPCTTSVIGETAYVRLHGRNEKGWLLNSPDTRYDYLYNTRELREIGRRLDMLRKRTKEVVVVCNNTTNAKAVANAFQIMSMVTQGKVAISANALNSFPHLHEIAGDSSTPLMDQAYRHAI